MARVTVKTLAAAVGVSPSTISNAYNRPDQLSVELRERILATATELGFAGPDAAGRTLRVGRADAVGVLLTERLSYAFSDPFAVELLTGVSEVAEEQGISIVLMPLAGGASGSDVTSVRQASIDAMATLSLPKDHPAYAVAAARGIRLVAMDPDPDPGSSWVAIDDHQAGALVGRHLRELGHRDVTVLVDTHRPPGPMSVLTGDSEITFADSLRRLAGLRSTVSGTLTMVSGGHNALASGLSAGRALVERAELPTAVVALSDVLALGVLEALSERGLGAPADVSVCGFDDVAAAAPAGLTTVRQPIRERGRAVGRLLVDPEVVPRQVTLPIELVVRGTTGPVRA